ncbi:MAG TPA: SpoIIE family protein phosphatase [Trebonia sp.]|nr:SpoIIE family protein phosphatase [Trebonia sp.]
MSRVLPPDLQAGAALGGEMGRRLLGFDWEAHPLGAPAGWPPALRAQVAAALASRFPTVLWLGDPLYLVYNDAYIPMLGDKHPAALGQPGAQVWWDIWDVVGPMLASVADTGVATWSDDLMLLLVNDGRRQERYFTFTYSPVLGPGGGTDGVFCAVTETTERVIGARRLQALNALAAALLDIQYPDAALEAAINVCAAHGADLPFAAVYLTDGPAEQARAHRATPAAAGLLPDSLAVLLAGAAASEDGVYLAGEVRSRLPGLEERLGDWCPEQALVIPVSEPAGGQPGAVLVLGLNCCRPLDGQYRGFCGLLADQVSAALAGARAYVDERRRSAALAELDAAKTTFLQNVSHEFRTPLTLMLGPLEDLIAAHAGDSEAEQLEMIRRNGRRLLRLVNSLLDFSRIEAGHARPQLAVTDTGALTARVASSFADVCRLAGIALATECAPAWALADAAMWETIVLNLISNAVKYTLAGSVTVQTGPAPGGGIEMTVADTGSGIAAEDLPHLFDRFYRAASSTGRSTEGSGIGLALVKSLVDMHGGTITVDSTPGAGTAVTVRLPAASVRRPEEAAGGTPAAMSSAADVYVGEAMQWAGDRTAGREAGGTRERDRALVLVADDNADMRAYLSQVLRARWDVVTAADGGQALELARRLRPDLLVADVMMPVLDGFGLVAAIRGDPGLALLPVVILTARAGVEAAGEGLASGADDYLVKPFSSADLVNRVAARLGAAGRDRARSSGLAGRRDQALTGLGTALAGARSAEQALRALLASPLCCLDATSATAGVLDETRKRLRLAFSGDIRTEVTDRYHLVGLDAPVPIAEVARSDQPMVVPDIAGLGPWYRQAADDAAPDVRAFVAHPLHDGDGMVTGALALNWNRPRPFTPGEVETTRRAAAMLARALARIAAAEREHQVAVALQERLLDLGATTTAAVVAAAYEPAGEALRVGGDWYTVTPLDDGRTGVSVGDVAGHGLAAAAVMSQLRSALGAVALSETEPAAVLSRLDRYARGIPDAMFATAAYAIVDSRGGTVDYSCAGHPYPLLVTPEGGTRFLRDGRRAPLGAKASAIQHANGHAPLPTGSMLVLYTDGLVERRGEPIDAGMARLAAAAAAAGCARLPAGAACAALLQAMAGPGGYDDDVAMIAVRPCGTTPDSHIDALPADFTEMAAARDRLRGWLRHAVPDPDEAGTILSCTGEALANAIEYGSDQDPDRAVTIEAFAGPDTVNVTVGDSGCWERDPSASRAAGRGRGLTLMHGLADRVQTTRTPRGTRVTMTCRISRPADRERETPAPP